MEYDAVVAEAPAVPAGGCGDDSARVVEHQPDALRSIEFVGGHVPGKVRPPRSALEGQVHQGVPAGLVTLTKMAYFVPLRHTGCRQIEQVGAAHDQLGRSLGHARSVGSMTRGHVAPVPLTAGWATRVQTTQPVLTCQVAGNGDAGEVEVSAEHIAVTADGRNSNGAQVTDITFQCKHCNTFMGSDVIKCFVCGAVGDSLVPVHKEGFKPDEKEMSGVKQMTTFDDKKVQWTEDALQKLENYPEGHVRRRAQARVEKNARVQSIETVSVAFLDQILNEKIVKKPEENKALENYMEDDEPKVTDFIWTEKANNRLELVPKGFMRDNTRSRVMAYAHSNDIKEITLEVCEAGIKDSVKMMEEAIANGATLEDFLPKKVDA